MLCHSGSYPFLNFPKFGGVGSKLSFAFLLQKSGHVIMLHIRFWVVGFLVFFSVGEECICKQRWYMYYNNPFKKETQATVINHVIIRTGRDNDDTVTSSDLCLFFPSLQLLEEVLIRDQQTSYIFSLFTWQWNYICSKRARKFICISFCTCHWFSVWSVAF